MLKTGNLCALFEELGLTKYNMGRSIDERDSNVDKCNEFVHCEIDTVIGSKIKSDNVVLTLVERITRKYIALKLIGKISFAVKEGIAYLEAVMSVIMVCSEVLYVKERGWTIIVANILCL